MFPLQSQRLLIGLYSAVCALGLVAAPLGAKSLYTVPKYAAFVINADSGEILYARQPDAPRYPASITKVMTLYLAFDALSKGRLTENDLITISPHAASQAPSKLGLKVGATISVRDAIGVIATRSANDIAVALAEHIGGSEAAYCAMMTARAHAMGMRNSTFVNATGLPDKRQLTTARDIATLSRAVIKDFPQYYGVFSKVAYDYEGQEIGNHNHLLSTLPGVDGIKTGFTNAAGFTLAASAAHDGVRLIAVVLGGPNRMARDGNVTDLLDTSFDVLTRRSRGEVTTVAQNLFEIDDLSDGVMEQLAEQGSGDDNLLAVGSPRAHAPRP